MNNSEILKTPVELLGPLDRQRRLLLAIACQHTPCPNCSSMVNKLEAAGMELDEFPTDELREPPFKCPYCKKTLDAIVPVFGPAKPYIWGRKMEGEQMEILVFLAFLFIIWEKVE